MTRPTGACRLHRPILEALVERGERVPATSAALDHLSTCSVCERHLTELALTVAMLRRVARDVAAQPVPAPSPPRIAALAVRRRRAGASWHLQLGSLLMGAAIAAIVVLPRTAATPVPASDGGESSRLASAWVQAERRLALLPDDPSYSKPFSVHPTYPDGALRPWKEVARDDAGPRVGGEDRPAIKSRTASAI